MITIKNQTIHELIVNVEASTFTVNPPLDIHQGDTRSHVMLIKLRNNEDFISLDKDITYKMFYYLTKDKKLIETSDVTVINYYRGILSHVISNKVVEEFGSYTCYLRGYLGEEIVSTISFPIVISKTHDYEAKSNEVIITKEFYDELKKHLNNDEIHLNEEDRDFLDTFNDQIEELSQVIERDKKIKNYYNENVTPFISIPEGLLILTGDMVFSEKDGTTHVVNSPANINHKVENGTHYISIVSNNDVIVYREDNEEFKFSSILYGGSGGDGWQSLIVNDPELITDDTKVWYDDKEHNIIEVYTAEESDSKYAPKPIIVTNQADITDDTEIYNELNNQNQIEVYTTEEIDEKINEVVEDIQDFDSQINALETEIQGKQDAGDYATSLELSNEVTARQSADNDLQGQISGVEIALTNKQPKDFIVTFTENGSIYSSDKKFSEIYSAYNEGKNIVGVFGAELYEVSSVLSSAVSFTHILLGEIETFVVTSSSVLKFVVNIQRQLTAGTGITITNDIISATLGWSISIVNTLPGQGEEQTFYFVPKQDSEQGDVYDEYIWINNAFELIGSTSVDLTDYYTKTETNTLLSGKQDTLVSGTNIKTLNNQSLLGNGNIDIQTTAFVATYTEENDTWTCDKTFAQIKDAFDNGEIVKANLMGVYELSLFLCSNDEGVIFAGNYCFEEGGTLNNVATIHHSTSNEISALYGQYVDVETLSTILDEKQNLPLIVAFTEQGGSYSADKSFTQIFSAYSNGYEIVGKFGAEIYNLSSISNSAVAFTHILLNEVNVFIVTENGVTIKTVNIQPLLSAGTGIAISGNVISATLNWNIVVVNQLPVVGESQTFYFVPKQNSAQGDVYDEYVWVNNAFEHIGSTEVDLSNYYTKAETNTLVNAKQDVLTAGQNVSINNNVISAGIEVIKI